MLRNGVNGVDGLDAAYDVVLSKDGSHVYVVAANDNAAAALSVMRNQEL